VSRGVAHSEVRNAFAAGYVDRLKVQIRKSRYFTVNNLNRDFVGTRGFSVVFQRAAMAQAVAEFPWCEPYLARALRADCNAFYLNPLQLGTGSRVDPHIDRSLHAYCVDIATPVQVSVLYVDVPPEMRGGQLVLQRGRKLLARVQPEVNLLVCFDGDLTHSVERIDGAGQRLSLVCEQYALEPRELAQVPEFAVESRAKRY
jgi:hypothetical protein